ncbi:DNA primase [Polymorphobacter sp. PAMC 29334]|uniref:DNA primase n=1 Tax=Polymorphobacter sp. PAMC 29334 TaxID=2862331 RepID=UPI001C788792|nr:DNA primase [Polymorphobacter sp. PAMC 29334]QYE34249.1 DNA primase [Polymorphobacter sp. PAMC 29334]
MTLAPTFLDELRARVAVSTVVARRVKLTRAGREMKGCCPFHNEKSPSFFVNDDKGFYHCFGCGAHGDVIRFVVEQEGLGFIDAVKSLAAEAGLAVPEETPEARERAQAAEGLHDVTGKAAAWFSSQLRDAGGATARDYLAKRGLADKTVADFGLGYSPDSRTRLRAALASVGDAKLIETGLLIQPEAEGNAKPGDPYDRFRGRLMFPIRDPRGRVIGFGGRILGDGQPKYLNSPDTPLFDKGRTLYNLDRAGPVARKSLRLIVVEGYMDVIGLAQAGFADAVAPLGTALTEAQLGLMWRIVPEPVLCFDGDAAGQRAGLRALHRALPLLEAGKSLRFATLPLGKDPDDLVRAGGPAAFDAVLAAAEPLIDRLWRSETEGVDTATPERRAAVLAALDARAAEIADTTLQRFYRTELRERFYALFKRPERTPWQKGGPPPRAASPGILRAARPDMGDAMVRQVLVACLLRPELIDAGFERLAGLPVADPAHAALVTALLDAATADPDASPVALRAHLDARGAGAAADAILARHRPGVGNLGFVRASTPSADAREQFVKFLDALLATARVGDDIAATNSHFRMSMAEADFDAVRRNHQARAELSDKDHVIGIVADTE